MIRHAVGCMTGTSVDGIDAVLVRAEGTGLAMRVEVLGSHSASLGGMGGMGDLLRAYAEGGSLTGAEVASLALGFGELHAETIEALLHDHAVSPDLCALHGQTVHHQPPHSFQLLNPWPVARRIGCRVVSDLRGGDLVAGGEGAPITPLADWVLFRSGARSRVIVNLGGFCNATVLPAGCEADRVTGLDVCACNQVLDRAARLALDRAYDPEGVHALRGEEHRGAGDALLGVLAGQATSKRSLGSGDEAGAWVETHAGVLSADDLLATAAATIGACIGGRIASLSDDAEVVLAGGGVHNAALVRAIDAQTDGTVRSDALGVGVHEREAAAIAVLGLLAMDGVAITVPNATGRTSPAVPDGQWIGGAQ